GAGNPTRARRLLWQGVWLAIVAGGLLSIPIALAPLGLAVIGVEAAIREQATIYLYLRLTSIVPFLMMFGLRSYLQALGRTRPMIIATIGANLVNAPLAW